MQQIRAMQQPSTKTASRKRPFSGDEEEQDDSEDGGGGDPSTNDVPSPLSPLQPHWLLPKSRQSASLQTNVGLGALQELSPTTKLTTVSQIVDQEHTKKKPRLVDEEESSQQQEQQVPQTTLATTSQEVVPVTPSAAPAVEA